MPKKKLPKLGPPLGIERDYQKQLRSFTRRIKRIIDENIVKSLPYIMDQVQLTRPQSDSIRFDNIAESVEELFNATRAQVNRELPAYEIEQVAQATATQVNAFQKAQITKLVKDFLGVDVFSSEPWLAQEMQIFTRENVNLIKASNTQFLSSVEQTVMDGMRRGLRHEEIAKKISGYGKDELGQVSKFRKAKNRANVIGRDQVNKFNGKLNELRQKQVGVKNYFWRTNIDGRERQSHNDWNEQSFSWKSGSPIGTHPGEEIQCRCYAEPDLSDLINN